MDNKKNKIYTSTVVIFWIVLVSSIITISNIFIMNEFDLFNRYLFFSSAIILSCLGIALVVLAAKAKLTRISKVFTYKHWITIIMKNIYRIMAVIM